jgi:ParB/RepB/Spo0J family partition protein
MTRRRQPLPTSNDLVPTSSSARRGADRVVQLVPVEAIQVDPDINLRRGTNDIRELAASIRAHGLLQPLVVRRDPARPDGYVLVAGHRRLAAIGLLFEQTASPQWAQVPVTLRDEDAERAYVLTLVENLQREELTPREESDALARLVRERRWSTRQVASAIQRSQAYVSRRLRVYEDPSLRAVVVRGQVPLSVAEELLAAGPERRPDLAKRAAREQWDQKRARAEARGYTAAFHPHLKEQIASIRQLVVHAALSVGECELLHQFALFILLQVPRPGPDAGVGTATARAEHALRPEHTCDSDRKG